MGGKMVSMTDITVLYEPQNSRDCCADIVFVHGLQGHPKDTWVYKPKPPPPPPRDPSFFSKILKKTSKSAAQKGSESGRESTVDEVFWPETVLPADCPSARIMTWGYNSHVTNFFRGAANQNSFYEHANDLLYALKRQRMQCSERPLIFVMHSLGGIIVKQALLDSNLANGKVELQLIESSTVALIFLGTPHRGSSFANWGQIASTIAKASLFDVNQKNIDLLQVHGEHLALLEKNFGRIVMQQRIQIHNFQESKGYKGIRGFNGRIVEPWSASMGDPGRERSQTIDSNHMEMCRYSGKDDPGYIKVGAEISAQVGELRKKMIDEMVKEYEDTLASLGEDTTVGMPSHVGNPDPGTFEWLAHDPRLSSWIELGHAIFAIKGKAGSGKSTAMKYLFDSMSPKTHSDSPKDVKVCFFFNEQGHGNDRSYIGMLRGLLCHLFQVCIDIFDSVVQEIKMEARRSRGILNIEWTPKFLRSLLILIAQRAKRIKIVYFVDALDECAEKDRTATVKFLNDWRSAAKESGLSMSACVSSRPEAAIDMDLSDVLIGSILLQNENHRDIIAYVNHSLGSISDPRRKRNYYANFAAKVAQRSDGVFLWVVLVTPVLKAAIARGETESELIALLERLPPELKDLYKSILSKIDKSCLRETLRMLQVVSLAQRPLYIEEFLHALAFKPGGQFKSLSEWRGSVDFIETGHMAQTRIQNRSGGLIEVCKAPSHTFKTFRSTWDEFENPADLDQRTDLPLLFLPPSPDMMEEDSNLPLEKHAGVSGVSHKSKDGGSIPAPTAPSDARRQNSQMPGPDQAFIDLSARWQWSDTQLIRSEYDPHEHSGENHSSNVVRLIHETARHFFVKGEGFPALFELIRSQEMETVLQGRPFVNPFVSQAGSYIIGGHEYMVATFFNYLELDETKLLVNQVLNQKRLAISDRAKLPLVQYIVDHWLTHVSEADQEGRSQKWVIGRLISYEPARVDICVCWAAKHNIISWIYAANELGIDMDTPELAYGRPIIDAVVGGHLTMVSLLVDFGANVNGITGGEQTTLRLATGLKNQEMVELLKKRGATLDQVHWLPPADADVKLYKRSAWS